MDISEEKYGTVNVLRPDGPLVDEECDDFTIMIHRQLSATNPRMVICMQEVPYVDSAGLEALLEASRQLRSQSCALKLASLTATCREILDLTDLMTEFEMFDDVEDAVRSFL